MFLSRLILNPRSPLAGRDLGDCQGLHRRIMSAWPDVADGPARERLGVLFRIEPEPVAGGIHVLVQSAVEPDWSKLPPGYLHLAPQCKPIGKVLDQIRAGMVLVFRLRANPTRKIDTKTGPDGQRRHGRRVDLRQEEDRLAWLARRAAAAGFEIAPSRGAPGVPDVRHVPDRTFGEKDGGRRLTFGSVLFEGRLRVMDAEKLRKAIVEGIGPGKAYGHGLLSVAPT